MSIDLSQIFGDAEQAASQGMSDVLQQGGNAALGFLEGKAIDVLKADQADKSSQFQTFVGNQLAAPGSPGSFGAYLSNLVQSPALKQYGPYILIGVGVIALSGILMGRR